MTIYKVIPQDKKQEKKLIEKETAKVPLTDDGGEAAATTVQVSVQRQHRSKVWLNVFLILMALLVLATGITGGYYLYKNHLSPKVRKGRCHYLIGKKDLELSKVLPDHVSPPKALPQKDEAKATITLEEEIEVIEDKYERIKVPHFEDILDSLILHDFERNYTAIVDYNDLRCFVMKLDRKEVMPPRNLIDLIIKINSGYYLPNADILRKRYRVMSGELKNTQFLGPYINRECFTFSTYKLEKMTGDEYRKMIVKRSAKSQKVYGYYEDKVHAFFRFELIE